MKRNIPPPVEQRCRAVLDTYGTRPAQWPDTERESMLACLAQSQDLQDYRRHNEELDQRIEAAMHASMPDTQTIQALQKRILNCLPAHMESAHHWRWLRLGWLTHPRFAMGAAAVLAVVLLLHWQRPPVPTTTIQADTAYERWAWYDITGQELQRDSSVMTMTDFVELDEAPGNS